MPNAPELDLTPFAAARVLVAQHRSDGMSNADIRGKLLRELQATSPKGIVFDREMDTMVAEWRREIDAALDGEKT